MTWRMYVAIGLRPDGAIMLVLTSAWTALVIFNLAGVAPMPGGFATLLAMPAVASAAYLLLTDPDAGVRLAAGWSVLLLSAVVSAELVTAQPWIALAPAALLVSTALCAKFPAAAVVTVFAVSGAYGSLQAFTGLSGATAIDLVLGGLWAGTIWASVSRENASRRVVWLSIFVTGAYVGVTTLQAFMAANLTAGFVSYRLSIWYMLTLFLIAYARWPRGTLVRIAKGTVMIAGLVGGYAVFRWFAGPASAENELALEVAGPFNLVQGDLRVFGSFNAGHQLGFWAGIMAPFCLAAAIGWRGRWRAIGGCSFLTLVFAEFASEVRAGVLGLLVGAAVVLVLFQLTRSVPGLRLGRTFAVAGSFVAIVVATLVFTTSETGHVGRYDALLDPSTDRAFLDRQAKADEALDAIADNPMGYGIGSASLNPGIAGPYKTIASSSLDNSYLKVAYEQGVLVLALFVVMLGLLLARLAWGSVVTPSRKAATVGIAAAGTLASAMTAYLAGMYLEDVIALGVWMPIGLGVAFLVESESSDLTAQSHASG